MIVDPGDAAPVLAASAQGLWPAGVLLTHHHPDHCGGVAALRERWPTLPVFAPDDARIVDATERVGEGSRFQLNNRDFSVLAVPGHTLSHIAFHGAEATVLRGHLFSLGCGRLSRAHPRRCWSPGAPGHPAGDTAVCCGHEYTWPTQPSPGPWTRQRRPASPSEEAQAMRNAGRPTLPSTVATETGHQPVPARGYACAAHGRRQAAGPGTCGPD